MDADRDRILHFAKARLKEGRRAQEKVREKKDRQNVFNPGGIQTHMRDI
jgi:hypothetical protein